MNKNHLSYKSALSPNFRFFLEIGFCILFALSFFLYFNPAQIQKDEKAMERLMELEKDVDELEVVMRLPVHLQISTWGRKKVVGTVEEDIIDLYVLMLDGLDDNYNLPKKRVKKLRERLDYMEESILEKELIKHSYLPAIDPYEYPEGDELRKKRSKIHHSNKQLELYEEIEFDEYYVKFKDLERD